MTSNLMDTAPGGESTQYESVDTVEKGHAKQGGQLSESATVSANSPSALQTNKDKAARGAQTAENIRYGQSISEQGMGGQTEGNSGSANVDVGIGRQGGSDGNGKK